MAVVQKSILDGNINQNIAKVRLKTNNFIPYFLGVFFYSKYGKSQLMRLITGNVQPYLNSIQIASLIVPILPITKQKEIASYYHNIERSIETSKFLYSQAENLFLEELGLKDFKPEEDLFYIANLSEVKSVHRMDAEYFQPKYEKLISKIKNQNAKLLGDLVTIKKGIEPGSEVYQEEGKLFIRVSNLSKQGLIDKDQKYLSEELYQKLKKDFEPKIGEILLTKDATPGIAYVLKEAVGGIISGGILRLKLKESIESEYLALCINSIVGQMQAERDGGGSIITHWKPDQIKNVLIPILPKPTQQKIADLVQKSHQSRQTAKALLAKAKQKVEELIEKNSNNQS